MIRPILIGPTQVERAKEIVAYAEGNRITLKTLLRRIVNDCAGVGLNKERRMTIPVDVGVAFSIEEHPAGWCRHMSIGVPDPARQRCIAPGVVPDIMHLFGIRGGIEDCQSVYFEDAADCCAINLIQDYEAPVPIPSPQPLTPNPHE